MEREPGVDERRLMRAVRSLAWNRKILPVIEERLERAEKQLRSYLYIQGRKSIRAGVYQVELDEEENVHLTRLPVDDWQQLRLMDEDLVGIVPDSEQDGPGILREFGDQG